MFIIILYLYMYIYIYVFLLYYIYILSLMIIYYITYIYICFSLCRGGTAARQTDTRETWNSTWLLATSGLPSYNWHPWEDKRLGERLGRGPFGRVWLPTKRVV